MADVTSPTPDVQHEVELPNGVIAAGMGGNVDAIAEQLEQRHEERQPAAATPQTQVTDQLEKPQTRGQKRFTQLAAERDTANSRADALERELNALKARQAAPQSTAQVTQPARDVPKSAEFQPTRPKPKFEEFQNNADAYGDFHEALADWAAEQRIARTAPQFDARVHAALEADRASRAYDQHVAAILERGTKAYPDFEAMRVKANVQLPPGMIPDILRLPNAEHVIYALSTQPDLVKEFWAIPDALSLGARCAQLSPRPAAVVPASTAPAVQTTSAPAPIQPVEASTTRTASTPLHELANHGDDYDSSGYREKRRSQLRVAK